MAEVLGIFEINAEGLLVAAVSFDADDTDSAFEELDARYAAGESAAWERAWSVIAGTYAGFNQRELPTTTPDWTFIDHRSLISTESRDLAAHIGSVWSSTPELDIYIETVHRLSGAGAIVTHVARGVTEAGFGVEWRMIHIYAVERTMISRCEMFDESDLDPALARFDELNRPAAAPLGNAASRVFARLQGCFAARDWVAMSEILADDACADDRHRVVRAEIRHGRDAAIESMKVAAGLGAESISSTVFATRGHGLALCRTRYSGRDQRPAAFHSEDLSIIELDSDDRVAAHVAFDVDDIDAAFEELDARYLSDEAAPHAQTWSTVMRMTAAFNRREFPAATTDFISIDHRKGAAFAPGELAGYLRATWDLTPHTTMYLEAVHRLSNLGAVFVNAAHGISRDGFAADRRIINVVTVQGELLSRVEIFDEDDLEAALARFDELTASASRLDNAATRQNAPIADAFNRRDLQRYLSAIDANARYEDRRKGLRNEGPVDAKFAHSFLFDAAESWRLEIEPVAIRGHRLALSQYAFRDADEADQPIAVEALLLTEVTDDQLIHGSVVFDADDIDAAFAELEAKYTAGEAAPHAATWSVITRSFAAFDNHELPSTALEWIDRRRVVGSGTSSLTETVQAAWDMTRGIRARIESVHRLNDDGAVITHSLHGTSLEGFDFEWRVVDVFTVDGDTIGRCEMFDEDDLDAALARFDELTAPVPRLENAATRRNTSIVDTINRRDLDAYLAEFGANARYDDRRQGLRNAGPVDSEFARGVLFLSPESWHLETEPVAVRGHRLALNRYASRDSIEADQPITVEMLVLVEVDDDGLVRKGVFFDPDDIDAAFDELDTWYLAGEAAPHADTWSAISRSFAAFESHEPPPTAFQFIDRRRLVGSGSGDLTETTQAAWEMTRNMRARIEAAHRLNDGGAVITHSVRGASKEGFDFELRIVDVFTVAGDAVSRCEMFDEADLDAALARFDELNTSMPRLDNAATRQVKIVGDAFNRRDLRGYLGAVDVNARHDDRRKGLRAEGPVDERFARALLFGAAESWRLTIETIAVRGDRLVLSRYDFRDTDEADQPIAIEMLGVEEVTGDQLVYRGVTFDTGDLDAAFEELETKYLAGEAARHAHAWSVIVNHHAMLNRHELTATAPELLDHRPLVNISAGDPTSKILEMWNFTPDLKLYIEAVHRLSDVGAVFTQVPHGSSQTGFGAEWRLIELVAIDGDRVSRCELFEESDLDAAIARFDELDRQ
ncbi:hypothetical protein DVS77_02525 [Mycolicibacterium moriokaense]|nr:hypothetical protein DVS77_02525 [Mycolicibacterium moriokaense]